MRSGIFIVLLAIATVFAGAAQASSADPASGAVEWQLGSDLYLAGRDYNVARKINGSLTATGGTIFISGDTTVAKDAWIVGQHVAVEGEVDGDLSIRSQDALINGVVKGNVSFYGMHLSFGPDARIDGDVDYFAALPAEIDAGAQISGDVKSSVLRDVPSAHVMDATPDFGERFYERNRWSTPDYHFTWLGAMWFGIAVGVVAALWPGIVQRLADGSRRQTFAALAIGIIWLVAAPVLAVFAAFTLIGLPLAVVIILLWPLSMIGGVISVLLVMGHAIGQQFRFVEEGLARRLAGVIVATFVLRLFVLLPGIGTLIWIAAVSFGIGAMALAGRSRVSSL